MESGDESKHVDIGDTAAGVDEAAGQEQQLQQQHEEWEDDPELDALKQKVKQMQEEAEALDRIQQQAEQSSGRKATPAAAAAAAAEKDMRSVYVGNVDYGSTPEELQAHFASCGIIDRITILCDKWTGKPKGYAYVMFVKPESVGNAVLLNETTFRGRPLKVIPKRTNVPAAPSPYGIGRGRGGPPVFGGYGRAAPAFGRGRGRGGGGRGRGRGNFFSPY